MATRAAARRVDARLCRINCDLHCGLLLHLQEIMSRVALCVCARASHGDTRFFSNLKAICTLLNSGNEYAIGIRCVDIMFFICSCWS